MTEEVKFRGTFWMRCAGATPRDRSNLRRALWAYVIWSVFLAGGTQLIKRDLLPDGAVPWVVAVVPSLVAVYVLVAWVRYLRQADELQRVIHLEAMALAFGGTWLGVWGYRMLERVGAPTADIADATVFLAILYGIGIVRGTWRYR